MRASSKNMGIPKACSVSCIVPGKLVQEGLCITFPKAKKPRVRISQRDPYKLFRQETLRDTLKDVAASYAAVAVSAVLIRKFANDEESNAS